jgi:hypothetical protein
MPAWRFHPWKTPGTGSWLGREEAYLERKFDGAYLDYKSRIRRWL